MAAIAGRAMRGTRTTFELASQRANGVSGIWQTSAGMSTEASQDYEIVLVTHVRGVGVQHAG